MGYPYVPARLVEGSSWLYIEFWVWSEVEAKLLRKRVGVGKGKTLKDNRQKAQLNISQINSILQNGYVVKAEFDEDKPESAGEEPEVISLRGLAVPIYLICAAYIWLIQFVNH